MGDPLLVHPERIKCGGQGFHGLSRPLALWRRRRGPVALSASHEIPCPPRRRNSAPLASSLAGTARSNGARKAPWLPLRRQIPGDRTPRVSAPKPPAVPSPEACPTPTVQDNAPRPPVAGRGPTTLYRRRHSIICFGFRGDVIRRKHPLEASKLALDFLNGEPLLIAPAKLRFDLLDQGRFHAESAQTLLAQLHA